MYAACVTYLSRTYPSLLPAGIKKPKKHAKKSLKGVSISAPKKTPPPLFCVVLGKPSFTLSTLSTKQKPKNIFEAHIFFEVDA